MTEFLNPYHFVPVSDSEGPGCVPRDPTEWPAYLTHRRFVVEEGTPKVLSGRLILRLTIEEATMVGGPQTKGSLLSARVVQPFRLDTKLALPGSALRGMFAAVAEAASNSTLRVLSNVPSFLPESERKKYEAMGKPDAWPLSLSSGPSSRQSLGLIYDYWLRYGYSSLLPLRAGDDRKTLTLAEQLFGVVEDKTKPAFALAGRLHVSNGIANGQVKQREVGGITKILDSPKPPSPSFYFRPKAHEGAYTPKLGVLSAVPERVPQGRKFYLHRKQLQPSDWLTHPAFSDCAQKEKHLEQKAEIQPITSGEFWFHIDFYNLSDLDFELLCYSIYPNAHYRHKIGLGRPLGLGKVAVHPEGLFLVDRKKRYTAEGFRKPKYHASWKASETGIPEQLYPMEARTNSSQGAVDPIAKSIAYRERVKTHYQHLLPILNSIELLGDPEKATLPVHYPQRMRRKGKNTLEKQPPSGELVPIDGPEMERNSYEWFVANDTDEDYGKGQFLRPLTAANTGNFTKLPPLYREVSSAPPPVSKAPLPVPHAAPGPQALNNTLVDGCRVVQNQRRSGRLEIVLQVVCGNTTVSGLLEGASKIPGAETKYPLNWTGKMRVLNVQRAGDGVWRCQFRPS